MKKMFLAGPFKSLVDPDTHVMPHQYINQFQNIIEYFEERGWSVHCAHKREKWGREFMTPAQCTFIDYEEISQCDYFVAFPGVPASPGTHIEMGWASSMKKPVILLLEENEEYAFLVQGLGEITSVKTLRYNKNAGVDIPQIEALIEESEGIHEPV
ncbi:nucleoside 2-deoxyribosyltransferase [Xenorhabdus sp. 42]|uniref:Nucleoside 2-deoxyribosyltransferase n=1 Tax=Xenorhabdus szentirmaii TaxID=290112 RepID=A0AAW3Z1L9_9GAMM|nr:MULTISPECIES: nucleoside 2-deoxyribosyltransferase [unclassified Xenorhabdus]MBD2802383.1 nucleoside 2-deoxyribosyltransferase [Xenorhabdus sp. M]MBD2804418.1 nucleoside 2-deoxyribosyltransferase [Xenorhabdus sp. ZM]MBD2819934.1 nucleoside 2-deoxyribosyltransferase [Xenorhabdus sp. 42]